MLVLLAASLAGADVYGRLSRSRPIQIDFEEKPLKKIDQGDTYVLRVSWKNMDRRGSYEGSFVFTSKGKEIRADCITFTFEGSMVTPEESANTLRFTLPRQAFLPGSFGVIVVEIVYNRIGTYAWEIGVAQFS